ncbi:MAG: molecular chaperone GrpE [Planctomycetota bacterium]|jgi:molecular chaperone GrpE
MKSKNMDNVQDDESLNTEEQEVVSELNAESTESETTEESSPEAQRDEYLELWKRAQADYKNLRRRGQADLEAGIRRSMQPLLDKLLLVLDHLDMALSAPTPTDETRNFAIGVQMTRDQMMSALTQEQVTEIATDGIFDPEIHQAVEMVNDSGSEPGAIVETLRKGFTWRGVVLRFAQVRVAADDSASESSDDETAEDTPSETDSE